jgi:uncharacterized protein YcbK (DUF882 family)
VDGIKLDRRTLVRGVLTLAAGAMIAPSAFADMPERRLAFRNVHNGEKIDARYFGANGFDAKGLAEINHGLRDWRSGQTKAVDRDLLDLLVHIRDSLGVSPKQPFELISGYRSPHTNALLREAGGEHTGVASMSQHLLAKATDVRMSGVTLDRLRSAAMWAGRGGVGFYPKDGFVHIDTGRVRTWQG